MLQAEKELRDSLTLKQPGTGRINYSVKAGAGGGKTTMLSFRICEQILEGTPIEQFVIITYTNAAAAELREKITTRLRKRIEDGISDPVQLANAQKALNNIELMQISTIHSFLLKILREYAFESGIVLDARMLESEEDKARKRVFFNEWFREHFKDFEAFRDDWTVELKDNKGSKEKKTVDHTREVFMNMFMDMANVREKVEYDCRDNSAAVEILAKDHTIRVLGMLASYTSNVLSSAPNLTTQDLIKSAAELISTIATVTNIINAVPAGTATPECIEAGIKLGEALEEVKKIQDAGKPVIAQRKNALKGVIGYYFSFPAIEYDWNFKKVYEVIEPSQRASKVAEYVSAMQKKYQEKLDAETQVLSNDDILYRAEKLLAEHTEIRDEVRDRYSKIYVDEFQDTTGLQTRIIKMLAQGRGTKPDDDTLASDKLLVVGDPKQSIYRFTGAEIAVYNDFDSILDKAPDTNAKSVSLDENFRSNKEIVDWVNDSFSKLIPGYSPMTTDWSVTDPKALHGVFRYQGSEKYDKASDVEAVAKLVKDLVEGENYLEEPDRRPDGTFGTPTLRRVRYSDIMIISKNTMHMSDYVKRFSELGIPANVQGKFFINKDIVLRNFVLLVDYFAGFKNKKKRITAAQIVGGLDATRKSSDIKSMTDKLWKMRKYFRIKQYDAAAIIRYLMTQEDLFLPKGIELKKERVRSYRIRLNQMVETCLMNNSGDLLELSKLMNKYIESEVKREIPLESNENALRLMNVHQAKGLTGQIVILADRSANEGCRFSGYKKAGKYYPAAGYKVSKEASDIYFPTFGYDMNIVFTAYREECEEAVRLQYVAATRAAHALIIMPVIGNADAWFTNAAYNYDSLPVANVKKVEDNAAGSVDAGENESSSKGCETDTSKEISTTEAINMAMNENSVMGGITSQINETSAAESVLETSGDGSDATVVNNDKYLRLADLARNKEALSSEELDRLNERQVLSVTPSGMEASGVTGYTPADKDYAKEERPGGNVFGTVMHRVYELIVSNYSMVASKDREELERLVIRFINQAVLEQNDNMRQNDDPNTFVAFLKPIMMQYIPEVIDPIMKSAAISGIEPEVYTEYSFSFYVDESEKADFINRFSKYFKHAERDGGIPSDCRIWVNGQADLVVKQADGRIKVYDYKSDAMNGKPRVDFEDRCATKYEGQLALYRYAIGKCFDVRPEEVETELVDLYR